MKITKVVIYSQDGKTVAQKQTFKGDVSVIVMPSYVRVTRFHGISGDPEIAVMTLVYGQIVNVRNWGD